MGGIEGVVLLTGNNGQARITIPAQESLVYINAVVLEPARVGLIAVIGEVISCQAESAEESAVKFDLRIQTQSESPTATCCHMVPAVRTCRQRGSRVPESRSWSRRWCARGNRRLLSLFFVPLIAEAQVTT